MDPPQSGGRSVSGSSDLTPTPAPAPAPGREVPGVTGGSGSQVQPQQGHTVGGRYER